MTLNPVFQVGVRDVVSNCVTRVFLLQSFLVFLFSPVVAYTIYATVRLFWESKLCPLLRRFSVKARLYVNLAMMMGFFSFTTVLVKINTDHWQTGFFVLTMIIIVFLNSKSLSTSFNSS